MKHYTHAWLAFMAIKRLEAEVVYTDKSSAETNLEYKEAAKSLVNWFHNYRDFVIKGAWYPDEVFKDNSTGHIMKYEPASGEATKTDHLTPLSISEMKKYAKQSPVYNKKMRYTMGNCTQRCEALSHGIVDSLKMQFLEDKGNPVSPSNNHLAIRYFILSHYIADCHMPLHCDERSFSSNGDLHGAIEKYWEEHVLASYELDEPNDRFYYDVTGYPLSRESKTTLMTKIENAIKARKFIYKWPNGSDNALDYMNAVAQHAYYMSYVLFPEDFNMKTSAKAFIETETYQKLDEYSFAILFDAIDSIARIWLHAWHRFLNWSPYLEEKEKQELYSAWLKEQKKTAKEAAKNKES